MSDFKVGKKECIITLLIFLVIIVIAVFLLYSPLSQRFMSNKYTEENEDFSSDTDDDDTDDDDDDDDDDENEGFRNTQMYKPYVGPYAMQDTSAPSIDRIGGPQGIRGPVNEIPATFNTYPDSAAAYDLPQGTPDIQGYPLLSQVEGMPAMKNIAEESAPAEMEHIAEAEMPSRFMTRQEQRQEQQMVQPGASRMNKGMIMIDGPSQDVLRARAPPSNYYLLDDGAGGELGIQNNIFSKTCCNNGNWGYPFVLDSDPYVCSRKKDLVPSNSFGASSYSSGCLCATKQQANAIFSRGQKILEIF